MSETLYRKYRPRNFAEVIGQAHIVRTLQNAVKNNRVGHAYLFTGPRGTGKTSLARILAKTINCQNLKDGLPCEKCSACQIINSGKSLDIIEIDAASNTGVDNIRELRETIALAPASLKYKVYIIDEVHMLSTGAFNALLKTLEEPPAHVVFILATTEIAKVPETIISRCQRFDFSRLPISDILKKLDLIARTEKVKIEPEALELVAIAAEGGMRDAESLLGQIIALEDKNITVKEAEEILGTVDRKTAASVAGLIVKKDAAAAIAKINELLEAGYDLQVFSKSLVNFFRQLMLVKINPELKKHFAYEMPGEQVANLLKLAEHSDLARIILAINLLIDAQGKIAASILPQLPLEIAIIKATGTFPEKTLDMEPGTWSDIHKTSAKLNADSNIPPKPRSSNKASDASNTEPVEVEKENNSSTISQPSNVSSDLPKMEIDLSAVRYNWTKLLTDIRPYNHSLSALLANCQPIGAEGDEITLATPYEFYADKLRESKNKLTVEEVLGRILGGRVVLKITVDKSINPKSASSTDGSASAANQPGEQDSLLDSALEIMGGTIVEE